MLLALFYVTLILFVLNYILVEGDYFHPTIILLAIFLVVELLCIAYEKMYAIRFNDGTFFIIISAFVIFTLFTVFFKYRYSNNQLTFANKITPIHIEKFILIIALLIQVINTLYFYKYESNLFSAYLGRQGSFSEIINIYDKLTKFRWDDFRSLGVGEPLPYRLLNQFTGPISYLILYVIIHNFIAIRKVDWLQVSILGVYFVQQLMTGSRSPLFRVITFAMVVYYILSLRQLGRKKLNSAFVFRVVVCILALVPLSLLALNAMGRSDGIDENSTFSSIMISVFFYVGAPLLNLNNYLESNYQLGENAVLWGEQTLRGLYLFLGGKFDISQFNYDSIISVNSFVRSSNGLATGNVFTTFYMFVYDFGYWGVIPMTAIIAYYYTKSYSKIGNTIYDEKKFQIDYRLFIYAYLFNDLVMLFFSNRFYETVATWGFVKFLLISFIFVWFLSLNVTFKYKK